MAESLLESHRQTTQQRLVEAVAMIAIRDRGLIHPERLTYARVAEEAGVSERTVYRAFPTKDDMKRAFLDQAPLMAGLTLPSHPEEAGDFFRDLTRRWDVRAGQAAPSSDEDEIDEAGRAQRNRALEEVFAAVLDPDLTSAQRRQLLSLFGLLTSMTALLSNADRWHISLSEAGEVQAWALETLISTIKEGNTPWTPRS